MQKFQNLHQTKQNRSPQRRKSKQAKRKTSERLRNAFIHETTETGSIFWMVSWSNVFWRNDSDATVI